MNENKTDKAEFRVECILEIGGAVSEYRMPADTGSNVKVCHINGIQRCRTPGWWETRRSNAMVGTFFTCPKCGRIYQLEEFFVGGVIGVSLRWTLKWCPILRDDVSKPTFREECEGMP